MHIGIRHVLAYSMQHLSEFSRGDALTQRTDNVWCSYGSCDSPRWWTCWFPPASAQEGDNASSHIFLTEVDMGSNCRPLKTRIAQFILYRCLIIAYFPPELSRPRGGDC